MSDLSAFFAGLILGDNTPSYTKKPKNRKLNSNIALQDIFFLQCLRNIYDGLENYVIKNNPSHEEFIEYIIPELHFTEPYTKKEKTRIQERKKFIAEYLSSMKGVKSDGLSALERIWRDKEHTPDFDNLDLLLYVGGSLLCGGAVIKKNGVIYEYDGSNGVAIGFFDAIPARFIFTACRTYSQNELEKRGYEYDYSRFEYNARAAKNGELEEWKIQRRKNFYDTLLGSDPEFFSTPWSDYTRFCALKKNKNKISKDEKARRDTELQQIIDTLSAEDIRCYADNINSRLFKPANFLQVTSGIVLFLSVVLFIVLGILELRGLIGTTFIVIPISFLILSIILIAVESAIFDKNKTRAINYIALIQNSYYSDKSSPQAAEYAELLKRI